MVEEVEATGADVDCGGGERGGCRGSIDNRVGDRVSGSIGRFSRLNEGISCGF